jgi:GT2 family glycosyltransferase
VIWFRVNIKTESGWFPIWVSEDMWTDEGSTCLNNYENWLTVQPLDPGYFDYLTGVIA